MCLPQQTPSGSFSVNYHEDLAGSGLAYDFGFSARHGAGLARSVGEARPAEPVVLGDLPPGFQSFLGRLNASFPITDAMGQVR